MSPTYTRRNSEEVTVVSVEHTDTHTFVTADSSGFGVPINDKTRQIKPGEKYLLETYNGGYISGLLGRDGWPVIPRVSDEEFEERRQELIRAGRIEREARLADHESGWYARQDQLPQWLQDRLGHFHANGGDEFRIDAWEYELVVCEIAALYEKSDGAESDEVSQYADVNGTSGNQHDVAKALAHWRKNDPLFDAGRFPAALTPLTGNPFYKGEGVTTP